MLTVEEIHAPPAWDGSEGLLALLVRAQPAPPGTHFATPPGQPLQVALISRPAGASIAPHRHPRRERTVCRTQEVLLVRRGSVTAALYTSRGELVCERVLHPGDVLILVAGGHGFTFDEDAELVEVKQGPVGFNDKVPLPTELPDGAVRGV